MTLHVTILKLVTSYPGALPEVRIDYSSLSSFSIFYVNNVN